MHLELSSKAKTLQDLYGVITNAKILPLVRFYVKDYNSQKKEILDCCLNRFSSNLIIRSSSTNEDNDITSNAGQFDSILNVSLDANKIDEAIIKVIKSYSSINAQDEIFIQPMLNNVTMSGVIFTADLDTLSSYYIVNYDTSGSTTSVTSGDGKLLKTFIAHKSYNLIKDNKIKLLLEASKECEKIFNNNFLDIEFAYSGDILYILQVRQIVKNKKIDLSNIDLTNSLNKIYKKNKKLNLPHPNLLGAKTIFAVMPDWNPAEIIGIKPRKLSLTLYQELITNNIWAYQRKNYGYRDLRSHPLLVSFLGIPYIDVRVSFNSFIPADLNENTARKLVNIYINKLENDHNKHDKIEFDIIYSCYYFGISKKLKELLKYGCNQEEIQEIERSLLNLTNNIIDVNNGLYKKDLKKIELLKRKYGAIFHSELSVIDKIYWMIEDCKRYGTLPFAGIARAAFIAMQFLKSLVDEGVFTNKEYNIFLNSLNTVSKQLSKDKNNLSKDDFLSKYGHLRPGTYDIRSNRYDDNFEFYFDDNNISSDENITFEFSLKQKIKIDELLKKNGLKVTFEQFITFIKESIEGREYSKFIFTKHLSQILKYIEILGKRIGLSKDELSHVDIDVIKKLYTNIDNYDVKDVLNNNINQNKETYKYTQAVKLPNVISNSDDVYSFYLEENEPNYVTLNSVKAEVAKEENLDSVCLKNKIVCINSADPGYDYLFTKEISGLITCYGGANSHMAIRCAELGIPAVIGCGENRFNKYNQAKVIFIDSLNKQVKIFS